jgi:hypothetical protein
MKDSNRVGMTDGENTIVPGRNTPRYKYSHFYRVDTRYKWGLPHGTNTCFSSSGPHAHLFIYLFVYLFISHGTQLSCFTKWLILYCNRRTNSDWINREKSQQKHLCPHRMQSDIHPKTNHLGGSENHSKEKTQHVKSKTTPRYCIKKTFSRRLRKSSNSCPTHT